MFDDIIKKPIDEAEAKFTKTYEKWIEDYQKLFKDLIDDYHPQYFTKPIVYAPYIPKPVEFIVFNFVITKKGVSFTDV